MTMKGSVWIVTFNEFIDAYKLHGIDSDSVVGQCVFSSYDLAKDYASKKVKKKVRLERIQDRTMEYHSRNYPRSFDEKEVVLVNYDYAIYEMKIDDKVLEEKKNNKKRKISDK